MVGRKGRAELDKDTKVTISLRGGWQETGSVKLYLIFCFIFACAYVAAHPHTVGTRVYYEGTHAHYVPVIYSQSDSRSLSSTIAFYLIHLGRLFQMSPEPTNAAGSAALGVPFSAVCLPSQCWNLRWAATPSQHLHRCWRAQFFTVAREALCLQPSAQHTVVNGRQGLSSWGDLRERKRMHISLCLPRLFWRLVSRHSMLRMCKGTTKWQWESHISFWEHIFAAQH